MLKPNLRAKKTNLGEGHSVFLKSGCVTVTQIVSMVPMKILLYTIAQHLSLALKINLHVRMVDVLTKGGLVIMIMIVETGLMKESSAILNTKLVHLKNLPVKTSNASGINIDAVRVSV